MLQWHETWKDSIEESATLVLGIYFPKFPRFLQLLVRTSGNVRPEHV